jgi:hypothetical protein
MDTWNKKVKVNKKMIPKKKVFKYYKKLWKENPTFRNLLRKKGVFVRASYKNGKTAIKRKGIKIKNINDLERAIKEHSVEFIAPTKNIDKTVVDIDMPSKFIPRKRYISRKVVNELKKQKIPVSIVTDSPRGAHIFSSATKSQLKKALEKIVKKDKDKKFYVGKSSKKKIVLDPYEPNVAIPDSLSTKGKPYKRWKKI